MADTLDIRDALVRLVEKAPAGGLFTNVETDTFQRNAFCLRLEKGGPIYTVEVRYGGSIANPKSK